MFFSIFFEKGKNYHKAIRKSPRKMTKIYFKASWFMSISSSHHSITTWLWDNMYREMKDLDTPHPPCSTWRNRDGTFKYFLSFTFLFAKCCRLSHNLHQPWELIPWSSRSRSYLHLWNTPSVQPKSVQVTVLVCSTKQLPRAACEFYKELSRFNVTRRATKINSEITMLYY